MSDLDSAWEALDNFIWNHIEDGDFEFKSHIGGQESHFCLTSLTDGLEYTFKVSVKPEYNHYFEDHKHDGN